MTIAKGIWKIAKMTCEIYVCSKLEYIILLVDSGLLGCDSITFLQNVGNGQRLHSITTQKTAIDLFFIALKPSSLTWFRFFFCETFNVFYQPCTKSVAKVTMAREFFLIVPRIFYVVILMSLYIIIKYFQICAL